MLFVVLCYSCVFSGFMVFEIFQQFHIFYNNLMLNVLMGIVHIADELSQPCRILCLAPIFPFVSTLRDTALWAINRNHAVRCCHLVLVCHTTHRAAARGTTDTFPHFNELVPFCHTLLFRHHRVCYALCFENRLFCWPFDCFAFNFKKEKKPAKDFSLRAVIARI